MRDICSCCGYDHGTHDAIRIAELQAENEHWRKHGPILIEIIEELVDEGVDLGTIGEGTKLRIDGYITAALGGSDDR